jgi:hypothetical protein
MGKAVTLDSYLDHKMLKLHNGVPTQDQTSVS